MTLSIIDALSQPLDPDLVKQREGAGGRKLDYLEGFEVINQANEIFGYAGWSMELLKIERENFERGGMFFATVKVTVHALNDIMRTDVGVGTVKSNAPEEIEKGYKEAVTDGMKRAFRTFGPQFGNELYNKDKGRTSAPQRQQPQQNQPPRQAPQPAIAYVTDEQISEMRRHRERLGWDAPTLVRWIKSRSEGKRPRDLTAEEAAEAINALGVIPTPAQKVTA